MGAGRGGGSSASVEGDEEEDGTLRRHLTFCWRFESGFCLFYGLWTIFECLWKDRGLRELSVNFWKVRFGYTVETIRSDEFGNENTNRGLLAGTGNLLDMPPSWVSKLTVSSQFDLCPLLFYERYSSSDVRGGE